jgi:hypothetical protein
MAGVSCPRRGVALQSRGGTEGDAMEPKRTWARVAAVAGGRRWHLLDMECGVPWCGRVLTALPTTVVHAAQSPSRAVCPDCLRAEERAFRAADKADKKKRKQAARVARAKRPVRPIAAGS